MKKEQNRHLSARLQLKNYEYKKSKKTDMDQIEKICDHIHDLEESGSVTIGRLRGVYPIRKTAEDSLGRGDLFVLEHEGRIAATAIINQIQVPDYTKAGWKYKTEDNQVMVLHTLIVDPMCRSKGYGKSFVAFYEEYAKEHGCNELRMDTNAKNSNARAMYKKLGYEEIDIVPCVFNGIPDVMLVCLEKNLE